MRSAIAVWSIVAAGAGACTATRPLDARGSSVSPSSSAPANPGVEPRDAAPHDAGPPPTTVAEITEALDVPGFLPSVLVLPTTSEPAPVVIVAHGAGGRPEPHCDVYRELVRGRGFILCTRGRTIDRLVPEGERGYFYDGHPELAKELRAALGALVERYGARVDLERSVYAGFSQGAAMGILALQQGVAPDAHVGGVLLVEGGWAEWTVALAEKLAKEGVRRVAIVCGRPVCKEEGDRSIGWMERGGLPGKMLYAPGAGHTYGGAVAPLVAEGWRWIVEDDPRWEARR